VAVNIATVSAQNWLLRR